MEIGTFVNTVILTTGVFAAVITSITNIVISMMNNCRLKKIEKKKQIDEIDKYRYSRLYDLILNWNKYDSEQKGKSAEEIAFYRLLNLFIDDIGRYKIAKPLLDKNYIEELEIKKIEGEKLLEDLVDSETSNGKHSKKFPIIKQKYFDVGQEFSEILIRAINSQLEVLLYKDN